MPPFVDLTATPYGIVQYARWIAVQGMQECGWYHCANDSRFGQHLLAENALPYSAICVVHSFQAQFQSCHEDFRGLHCHSAVRLCAECSHGAELVARRCVPADTRMYRTPGPMWLTHRVALLSPRPCSEGSGDLRLAVFASGRYTLLCSEV